MLNRTPFFEPQTQLKAKFVEFFGWEMPIQFTTITLEHQAVRGAAGLFDISHMGQIMVQGPTAEMALQHLVTNDVRNAGIGKGIYAHLLNENGGVIDDIFIFRVEEEKFLVIVNASRKQTDLEWIISGSKNFGPSIMEGPHSAGLALQGPNAESILESLLPEATRLGRHEIGEFSYQGKSVFVSRTGYTGEDGFELFAPTENLVPLWNPIFKAGQAEGLVPCGLGARDTLRTESAYPLYGHELDEHHTPFEANMSWVVKLDKGNFIGREALAKQKAEGIKKRLFGFKVKSGGVARPGNLIFLNSHEVGTVASGTFSPTLSCSIGMAYLPADTHTEGTPLTIQSGTRQMEAMTVKLPFYSRLFPLDKKGK